MVDQVGYPERGVMGPGALAMSNLLNGEMKAHYIYTSNTVDSFRNFEKSVLEMKRFRRLFNAEKTRLENLVNPIYKPFRPIERYGIGNSPFWIPEMFAELKKVPSDVRSGCKSLGCFKKNGGGPDFLVVFWVSHQPSSTIKPHPIHGDFLYKINKSCRCICYLEVSFCFYPKNWRNDQDVSDVLVETTS